MSNYYNFNLAAIQPTPPRFVVNKEERSVRKLNKFEEFISYAEHRCQFKFTDEFKRKMKQIVVSKWGVVPSQNVINGLIREWHIWEPYVTPDSMCRFIEDGIKSILLIHATATFYSKNLKGYIGNKATVIKPPPTGLATCVSWDGTLCKDGKPY